MIKIPLLLFLLIFLILLSYSLELSIPESQIKRNEQLCEDIFVYLNISNKISTYSKDTYKEKCMNIIDTIRKKFTSEETLSEGNEFLLSILHMKSLHATDDENYKPELLKILSTLEPNGSEEYLNEKVNNLIKFNNFLLNTSNIKNVEEFLVLSSEKDSYMNEPKKNIIKCIKNSFSHHGTYFTLKDDHIELRNEISAEHLIHIYRENICLHHIHLCQKFYQQLEIYFKMKEIFLNLTTHIKKNCKIITSKDISNIFNMNKKVGDIVQVINNYVLEDELYIIDEVISRDLENIKLILHQVDHKSNRRTVLQRNTTKVIDLKKELNNKEKYNELIESVKSYILSITEIDSDISTFVQELEYEDIEKFILDLHFFIHYGFIHIDEDKSLISADDVLPTFVNLYRANNITFLYILKTVFEENKHSEFLAYKFYNSIKKPATISNIVNEHFPTVNDITNLKELDKKRINQHFLKYLGNFLEHFEPEPSDAEKIQFFFTMAFKDCNINQNYSKYSWTFWIELLYAFDKFGWFYVHPTNLISSIKQKNFIRHILISRNFNLRHGPLLAHLDTQISKLIDFIYLVLEMDKSLYSLNFSIQSNFFKYANDFYIFKKKDLKTKFTYDYIDSIANNFYFFNEENNDVFNNEYNDKFYFNLPNVYSLAYQLFNEMAINVNVITNSPLKRKLKDKLSYAFFTILNIIGKNHDIYSKGHRYVFAAYVLALVYYIESNIDISRIKPKDFFFLKQSQPLIDQKNADDLSIVKKNCSILHNFMKINKFSNYTELTHVEEVMKILSLIIVVLWGKESKKSVYYDEDVSLYKKLIISCIFNGGKTIQEKLVEDIRKSCDISFYGLTPKVLKEIIEINLSINKWNPAITEKMSYSFVLNCQLQRILYDSMNIENITLRNFSKLAMAPELLKTYHCFKLGRQAAKLLESIILKKKFVRFRINDAIDVYDFFYTKKVISNNISDDYVKFLNDKSKYEKNQFEAIMKHSPLSEEETKNLINNYECYWFSNFENFKILWMHVSSKLGTGTYLRNFFSEIWANVHYIFKKKVHVKDAEYFPADLADLQLLDLYSPLVVSEIYCQEQMQILFLVLKENKQENRSEIPDKIKTAYFQCKLNYYKDHHSDFIHKINPNHFMNEKVYVFKQPYYLIQNIDHSYEKKLLRLFITEKTLEYLLMDDINIPECFGRCTTKNFNRVILENHQPKKNEVIIKNALTPKNIRLKKKKMIVYVNEAFVHNLNKDYLTNEKIRKIDIENNSVKVCMGKSTYFVNSFLQKSHFNLSHKPTYDFSSNHNFYIFLKKNEHLIHRKPYHECFINYDLSISNIDVDDPLREVSEDLIKNLYFLKNK